MNDTSPEALRVQTEIYRRMTPAEKLRLLEDLYRTARVLFEAGLRLRNPIVRTDEVREAWLLQTLEPELFDRIRNGGRGSTE